MITHGRMASGPAIVSKRLRMQLSPTLDMLFDHKTLPSLQTLHETLLNLKTHLILDHKTLLDYKRLISRKILLKRRRLATLPVPSLILAQRTLQGASNSRNLLPAQVFLSSFCACRFNIRIVYLYVYTRLRLLASRPNGFREYFPPNFVYQVGISPLPTGSD